MSALTWDTVEVYVNRGMAHVAGSALDAAGLPYRVVADDAGGMGLPLGLGSAAELQVPAEHAAAARQVLAVDRGAPATAEGGHVSATSIAMAGRTLVAIALMIILVASVVQLII